jgi:hypothetical protein
VCLNDDEKMEGNGNGEAIEAARITGQIMSLVKLVCRGQGCGKKQSFPVADGVTPSPNFLCRDCTAGRSMTDGRNVADLNKTELASRVYREGRGENVVPSEPGESAIGRWNRLNPEWRRVYRQLHRAGYRRPKRAKDHPPPSVIVALWHQQVARFDWKCADCNAELTPETVHCSHPESGFRLEDCVPVCRRCSRVRAAQVRWHREKNRQDARENLLSISEGKEIAFQSPTPSAPCFI